MVPAWQFRYGRQGWRRGGLAGCGDDDRRSANWTASLLARFVVGDGEPLDATWAAERNHGLLLQKGVEDEESGGGTEGPRGKWEGRAPDEQGGLWPGCSHLALR